MKAMINKLLGFRNGIHGEFFNEVATELTRIDSHNEALKAEVKTASDLKVILDITYETMTDRAEKAEAEHDRLREAAEGVREQLAGGVMNDTIADILHTILDEALNHKEG